MTKSYKFQYTLLNQDGTTRTLRRTSKMTLKEMYKVLDCELVELIPRPYYPKAYDNEFTQIWGDEEGRFTTKNYRNPHTLVLKGDPEMGEMPEWDCVGDLLAEVCTNAPIDEAEEAQYV